MTGHTDNRTVATFASYGEAEQAVDRLTRAHFPVERVSIVGQDLRLVEQVVGRATMAGAVWRGAGGGALTGFLIGWVFGWFNWLDPVVAGALLATYGLVFGAAVGALFGLVIYAMQRGTHEYESVRAIRPGRYELQVDVAFADQADRLLNQTEWSKEPHHSDA